MKKAAVLFAIIFLLMVILTGCTQKYPTDSSSAKFIFQGVITDNGAEYLGSGAEYVVNAIVTLIDQADSSAIFIGNTNSEGEYVIKVSDSSQYLLRVTGNNIETHEHKNLEIAGNMILDITVKRTVTDIDGNVYSTAKIGDQWWLGENLRVTHYANGDTIPNIADYITWTRLSTGAWCVYDNDESYTKVYGYLYNWYTVKDSRNIAPAGWHVPDNEEWKALTNYLGGESIAGGKMKETGTAHWNSPNTGATNESGFSSLAGGCRINVNRSNFKFLGHTVFFWSSTDYDGYHAWYLHQYYLYSDVYRGTYNKPYGYSVRLIRD